MKFCPPPGNRRGTATVSSRRNGATTIWFISTTNPEVLSECVTARARISMSNSIDISSKKTSSETLSRYTTTEEPRSPPTAIDAIRLRRGATAPF